MMDIENSPRLLIALILAILIYAGKYYYDVGQVCAAMWFGSYPLIFIGIGTSLIYKLLSIPEAIAIGKRRKEEREEQRKPPRFTPPPRKHW